MNQEVFTLAGIAFLAFFHTAVGPDHYLPFIALSRSGNWSAVKTYRLTALCGAGHVISSILIGLAALALGITLDYINWLDGIRGDIAAWLLMCFGLLYLVLGLLRRNHTHALHRENRKPTAWILFIIFIFGPCEVLIPMMLYYGIQNDFGTMLMGILTFGTVTIMTMLGIVFLSLQGVRLVNLPFLSRHIHVITGALIILLGAGIRFLGW